MWGGALEDGGEAYEENEARKVGVGWVLKRLANHAKDFGLHPEDSGKSLKSFRPKGQWTNLCFRAITLAF